VQQTTAWKPDDLLSQDDAAPALGIHNPRTLAAWRSRGYGPPFVRIGRRCVRYRYGDLLDYVARQTVEVGEG